MLPLLVLIVFIIYSSNAQNTWDETLDSYGFIEEWRSTSDFVPVQSQSFGQISLGQRMSAEFDFVWGGRSNDPSLNKYEMFFRVGYDASGGNGCDGQGARYPSFWLASSLNTMHVSVSDGASCQPGQSLIAYGEIQIGPTYHIKIDFNETLLTVDVTGGGKPDWRRIWNRTATQDQYIGVTVPVWWMSNKYSGTPYNRGNGTFSNVVIKSDIHTLAPTAVPTVSPTAITASPTLTPTASTAAPSKTPTQTPSRTPSVTPTKVPSSIPTQTPSSNPTTLEPTSNPSTTPTSNPSSNPTTLQPTSNPSKPPTSPPTSNPSINPTTSTPTSNPSLNPSITPSSTPTINPSVSPTGNPSLNPTTTPSSQPTTHPSISPTSQPSTERLTNNPSLTATTKPPVTTTIASSNTAHEPSISQHTSQPTTHPTDHPTRDPTDSATSTVKSIKSDRSSDKKESSDILLVFIIIAASIIILIFGICCLYRVSRIKVTDHQSRFEFNNKRNNRSMDGVANAPRTVPDLCYPVNSISGPNTISGDSFDTPWNVGDNGMKGIYNDSYSTMGQHKIDGNINNDSIMVWLETYGLNEYYDIFRNNGYETVEFIKEITTESELIEIGIMNGKHRELIMRGIKELCASHVIAMDRCGHHKMNTNIEAEGVNEIAIITPM